MRERIGNFLRPLVLSEITIETEGRTLGTATSVGGTAATIYFPASNPIRLVYTDPDGRNDDVPPASKAESIFDTQTIAASSISAEIESGPFYASGEANVAYAEVMIRGQGTTNTTTSNTKGMIGVYSKASAANASGKAGVGNEDVSVSVKGVGDVLTVSGQAGVQYEDGFNIGAEGRASLVSGRATIELDVFSLRIEVGVSGHAGSAGASAMIGYTGSRGFQAKLGASLGVGADFILRVQKKP
jgi:hypothetical protein